MPENYTITEHVHRYACWAAARASSISRFSNNEIEEFIKESKLQEQLQQLRQNEEIDHLIYKSWFVTQVNAVFKSMESFKERGGEKERKVSFGVAAKVVSIYVKTAEIIPSGGTSAISNVAIPPIDRFLLTNLKEKLEIENTAWSKMQEEEYMELVEKLKRFNAEKPFWALENYWKLN